MDKKNVDLKSKTNFMPVAIYTHFETLEQKLVFEAVVLPDIRDVLIRYAPVLGYNLEREEKNPQL